ncbi:MAG: hypothetical protein EA391_02315 [Balneolaceae bacterium]|nr:MAG: hypothetical protein EA391_02315 [Balneolaceae bacterium]
MKICLRALLLSLIFIPTLWGQNGDFEKYPQLNFNISHLEADIRIQENGTIEGDLRYQVIVTGQEVQEMKFDAARMTIQSVSVNGVPKDHRFEDHTLVIELNESVDRGEALKVQIIYEAVPVFGIHKNVRGTLFTSQLPRTTHHWLPVIDHPRAEFTTDISFTHPTGYTFVATGNNMGSELLNVDEETTRFGSSTPVPASALAWVMGNFEQVLSTSDSEQGMQGVDFDTFRTFTDTGSNAIHFYSETNDNLSSIIEPAISAYLKLKGQFGRSVSGEDIHIVVLEDDFWETKNYGAGVIYVYKNLNNLEDQVKRALLAQWFGVNVREIQWSDSDAILALQALKASKLFDLTLTAGDFSSMYDAFGTVNFSRWLNFTDQQESAAFSHDLRYVIDQGVLVDHKLLSWGGLSELIYNATGQPYFEGITLEPIIIDEPEQYVYRVSVEWEEGTSTAQVRFEAEGDVIDELVSVVAAEQTFTGQRTHDITFSGRTEAVVINVSSGIENIKFNITDRDDIELIESKPFMFWLHQLRESEDSSRRVAAAAGLAEVSDNPDLQLALNDLLQMESNPEVLAEIIRSMGKITRGASGTEERFIQNSSINQHRAVQLAAVEVLGNFEGNQRVIGRLRTVINQTEYSDVRKAAIHSLFTAATPAEFRSTVQNVVTREEFLDYVPLLLELLAEKGEREAAVDMAETFLSPEFPFHTRKGVLEVMLAADQSPSNWNERLPDLLADADPRIRYKAADALQRLSSQQRNRIISDRIEDEFDVRVYQKLR